MAFRQQQHHLVQPPPPPYKEDGCYQVYEGERIYSIPPPDAAYTPDRRPAGQQAALQRNERLAELGAVAAGAFALYEARKAKEDPVYAAKHKLEAEMGGLGALGSAGYGYYEHRQKDKYEDGVPRW